MRGNITVGTALTAILLCSLLLGTAAFGGFWMANDMGLPGSPVYASLSVVQGKTDHVWAAGSTGGLDLLVRSSPTGPWAVQPCNISGNPVYTALADDTRDAGQTMRCFAARSTGGVDLITWTGSSWQATNLQLSGNPAYTSLSVVQGRVDWIWASRTGSVDMVSQSGGIWSASSLNLSGSPTYSSVTDNTSSNGANIRCFAAKSSGGMAMISLSSGNWIAANLALSPTLSYRSVSYIRGRSDWAWAARPDGDVDLVYALPIYIEGSSNPSYTWTRKFCNTVYSTIYPAIADDTTGNGQVMRCFAAKSGGGAAVINFMDGPWSGNQLGEEDVVLQPFTPIVVGSQSVSMWGRTYRWNNSLFPVQITSAGKDVLIAPIELTTSTPTGSANTATVSIIESSATRAVVECRGYFSGAPVKATHLIEYDGMCLTTLDFNPIGSANLSALKLYVPYKADEASLYHWYPGAGAVRETSKPGPWPPVNGNMDMAFTPSVWLGNADRGVAWFAESRKGWKVGGNSTPLNVMGNAERTALTVKFYNAPFTMSGPLSITFGIMATPVKQLPSDWRFRRNERDFELVWCDPFTGSNNYITHVKSTFRDYVTSAHTRVPIFVPYQRPDWINTKEPETEYYWNTWQSAPTLTFGTDDGSDSRHLGACLATDWADFLVYYAMKAVDTYKHDGYYFDGGTVLPPAFPCTNVNHGHGWLDDTGQLQGTYPLIGYRNFYKRMAAEFQKRGEPYLIWCHDYFNLQMPTLSFVDQVWDGEQFWPRVNPSRNYGDVMDFDWFRTEFFGQQFGVIVQWLGEFMSWTGYPDPVPSDFNTMLMFSLPHGIADNMMASYWVTDANKDYLLSVLNAQEAFGVRQSDCKFVGYWENGDYLTLAPTDGNLVCSVWVRPDKALLVLSNISKSDKQATVNLNLAKLGFPAILKATDVMSQTAQSVTGQTISVTVPQSNWRLIEVRKPGLISNAITSPEGAEVSCTGIVSAAFTDLFYIESPDRSMGIRVSKPGHNLTAGMGVVVSGYARNDVSTGERYIEAQSVSNSLPSGDIKPLGMTNKSLGGADMDYVAGPPASGQVGITGATGLNNICLLVKTTGRASNISGNTFMLDDGSGVGVQVVVSSGSMPTDGQYVIVTGISTCWKNGENLKRQILATD